MKLSFPLLTLLSIVLYCLSNSNDMNSWQSYCNLYMFLNFTVLDKCNSRRPVGVFPENMRVRVPGAGMQVSGLSRSQEKLT